LNPHRLSISKPHRFSISSPSPWCPRCAWCSCYQINLSPRSSSTPSRISSSTISEPSQ
jgi:hypothetical protein